MTQELLAGWGRTAPTSSEVLRPRSGVELDSLVRSGPSPLVARGLGRSYGDAAQCAGGAVVDMTALEGVYAEDLETGTITVSAGTSFDSVMRAYIPRGWFVPVTPGTRFVTVGGAIAADVHGKNHHVDGSFGQHVRSLSLVTPSGSLACGPDGERRDAFWATVGGMGLTGIVEHATVSMIPVETSAMVVDIQRCANIEDLMTTMSDTDHLYRYSVAWIDCLSTGGALGRAVLTRGDHARRDAFGSGRRGLIGRRDALGFRAGTLVGVPAVVPSGMLNRLTVRAFNEAWFRKAPRAPKTVFTSIPSFFHPLDSIGSWNRLYGPRGFLQYQMVLPFGAETELRLLVETLARSQCASFLAVLKRFGAAGDGLLSFPMPGWTLALDIPVGPPDLGRLLDGLDDLVAGAGGRVYLAKDARLRPELVPVMYPRLEEWRALRSRLDPGGHFTSDLARRLDLV